MRTECIFDFAVFHIPSCEARTPTNGSTADTQPFDEDTSCTTIDEVIDSRSASQVRSRKPLREDKAYDPLPVEKLPVQGPLPLKSPPPGQ